MNGELPSERIDRETLRRELEEAGYLFTSALDRLAVVAHRINVANGFWDDPAKIERAMADAEPEVKASVKRLMLIARLGLVMTEPSEAIEAVRKDDPSTYGKPDEAHRLVRELAGTIIRCLDTSESLHLPIGEALMEELTHNLNRGYKHGKSA